MKNDYSLFVALPFVALMGSLICITPALAGDAQIPDNIKRRMNRAALVPDTLQNPGFESRDASGKLADWLSVVHGGDSYHVNLDETQALAGKNSLIIKNTGTPSWGGAHQTIRAERMAGREIELTAQVKAASITAPGFYVALKITQMGRELNFIKSEAPVLGDADWKKISLRAMLPKETTHLEVSLILDGDGSVWVDDVRLDLLPAQ